MLRVFSFLILIIICISCDYISLSKKEKQPLDTIIDFTKVDVLPSFKVCNELLDKAKADCFRVNMQQELTKHLRSYSFVAEKTIDETVLVTLLITNEGVVTLREIQSSYITKESLPDLQSYIKSSIDSLPKLSPAIKRGIPVATEYKLPIRIRVD